MESQILKTMLPMLKPLCSEYKDVIGENPVAEFMEHEFGVLFETEEDIDNLDALTGLIKKGFIIEANKSPDYTIYKMLRLYEAFRKFYIDYQSSNSAEDEYPEEDPEPDEET